MATITTRTAKGAPLTNTEVDANFTGMNTELADKQSTTVNVPGLRPSLLLDFAGSGKLDPRVSFSRPTSGTYFDANGILRIAPANTPRFEFDPVTGAPRGLMVEEARTNLLLSSTDLLSLWSAAQVSASSNSAIAPDGSLTADTLSNTASVSGLAFHYVRQTPSLVSGTTYTLSVFAKAKTGSGWFWLLGETSSDRFCYFNVNTGVIGTTTGFVSASMTPVGNGWYRCAATFTKTTASTGEEIGFGLSQADDAPNWNSGGLANTQEVYLWGAQLEAGVFATSYIPTVASAVTRAADIASISTAAPWYRQDAGTVLVGFDLLGADASVYPRILSWDGGGANFFECNSTSMISFNPSIGSSFSGLTHLDGTKAAYAWSSAGRIAAADGALNSGTTAITTPLPLTSIEMFGSGQYKASGHVKTLAFYPARLTNAQLQALTV